jgi:PhnB protein
MGTDQVDSMEGSLTIGNNFYITLEPENSQEADELFHTLSSGGKVDRPLKKRTGPKSMAFVQTNTAYNG